MINMKFFSPILLTSLLLVILFLFKILFIKKLLKSPVEIFLKSFYKKINQNFVAAAATYLVSKLFRQSIFIFLLIGVTFCANSKTLPPMTFSSMSVGSQTGTANFGTAGSVTFLITWNTVNPGTLTSGTFSVTGLTTATGAIGHLVPQQ